MQNVTQIMNDEQQEEEEPSYSFSGGVTGLFSTGWHLRSLSLSMVPTPSFPAVHLAVLSGVDARFGTDRYRVGYAIPWSSAVYYWWDGDRRGVPLLDAVFTAYGLVNASFTR